MNTKTMRLPPRRVLTPSTTTTSNKRKERDDPSPFERPKPDKPLSRTGPAPMPSNQLLAGYLAHEYLTKGTLLGQSWLPGKTKEEDDGGEEGEAATDTPCRSPEMKNQKEERERYVEVTGLLKGGGTHLHGVVNPTQLARFLHL